MVSLPDYLAAVAARRFAYGALDCCTLMADWLVARGFSDPMADRRGSYADFEQYRAALRGEGGLIRSCARRFAAVGLHPVDVAVAGDVCLVKVPGRMRDGRVRPIPTGAICVSEKLRAVVTRDAGVVVAQMTTLRAWGVAIDAAR